MDTTAFWNGKFGDRAEIGEVDGKMRSAVEAAATHFGPLKGKRLLDVGCGRGATSLFFAHLGASVISVDQSDVAISNLSEYCREHGVTNVVPVAASATDISKFGPVDFIFGSMILHHVEPFESFAALLRQTLVPGGRCFFFENNASSKTLIWFRSHVVGKWGIPKYGDSDEFPLSPGEVDVLRRHFSVEQIFPYLFFFQMASVYLFRGRLEEFCEWLDRAVYRIPAARKLSYRQYVYLS
jgi:SAM-dependent methyltransferase